MKQKTNFYIFYIILFLFTAYFSNIICGKFLLTLLMVYFLIHIFSPLGKNKKILFFIISFFIFYLSSFNSIFLIAFPILFLFINEQEDNNYRLLFLNSLLLFAILENVYYTGVNLNILYYFWGLPVLLLAILVSKTFPKLSNIFLSSLLLIVITGQIIFNQQNYNQNIYTYSVLNSVVARHSLLKDYFSRISNLEKEQIQSEQKNNSFNILALCETKFLNYENIIMPNRNYILLGEHDNMNNFIEKYPYFNNDSYFRKAPWYLYTPNMNSYFKYFSNKDIFYSSNIGSTVTKGMPIIWEYDNFGKPILLATFAKINNSNIFIFGDSDLFVDKLIPYNINFIAGLLGNIFSLYPLFIILFITTNLCLLKNKKIACLILLLCMIIVYFLPFKKEYTSKLSIYSEIPYLTAHTSGYPSSVLNFLAQSDVAVIASTKKNADVKIINKNHNWDELKNSKLVYIASDTLLELEKDVIYCSNIKLGNEKLKTNDEIIDSRYFVINGNISGSGYYKKENTVFVCTGSPQLNRKLTKGVVLNEK